MKSVDASLTKITEKWDLLKHPFYVRWKAGELTRDELADYACQYAHVVRAIPGWLSVVASQSPARNAELEAHAAEEQSHVELWDRFALALGVAAPELQSSPPNAATSALLEACSDFAGSGCGAAAVWALEAQSPEVSAEKLRGLEAHYGISATSGGEYFALHQDLDRAHEVELRQVIAEGASARNMVAADAVSRGLWELLSSVERAL